MSLDLSNLEKALFSLDEALRLHQERRGDLALTLALRDSVIQRFEYSYELSWKMLGRWIKDNVSPESASPTYSVKELYRIGAKWGLVAEPLRWFSYHEARNLLAHTYNELNAERAFKAALGLTEDGKDLLNQLKKRND